MKGCGRMKKYFAYLDSLRASGKVNMLGAAPYLAEEFNLSISEARKILYKWIDHFPGRTRRIDINIVDGEETYEFN